MTLTETPTSPWDVADIFANASFLQRRRMVLDFITAHPEHHNQAVWAVPMAWLRELYDESLVGTCGTVACVAGWTCIMAGDELTSSDGSPELDHAISDSGAALEIPERAMRLLGLTKDEADELFYDINSGAVRQLRKLAS